MTIYSIHADKEMYRTIGFDRDEMTAKFGRDPHGHFDVNYEPRGWASIWKPVQVDFGADGQQFSGDLTPEISEFDGRLFLSGRAYQALRHMIARDGEFLPVIYEGGQGWLFNPLSLAEDVEGLDEQKSVRNEWGDIESLAFHEERVERYHLFRSLFDSGFNVFCGDGFRQAVEESGLKGIVFSVDLGNPYTAAPSGRKLQG